MISKSSNLRHNRLLTLAVSLGVIAFPALPVSAASEPAVHTLKNEVLTVTVMDPNHPQRYNRGSRFSPVANILQVSLGGENFLYCPVQHDPIQENAGLAGEFDVLTPGGPPGFSEAKPGEGYVKIGVGVLRKAGNQYDFFSPAEILERTTTDVTWTNKSASFQQVCRGANGYAYKLDAEIALDRDRVSVTWHLQNTGTKPFSTEQYAHNFFSFSDKSIGPSYIVDFPAPIEARHENGSESTACLLEGTRLSFPSRIKTHVNAHIDQLDTKASPGTVKTYQSETGQEIIASVSVPVIRTFIHATERYLCPEQFVRISLNPGGSHRWSREYRFRLRDVLE